MLISNSKNPVKDFCWWDGAIPAVDPAEVFGAGANLKRRLTSLFIPLNASG